ncbi:hypothetical protein EV643_116102 [Kribbella sp. VKM Ac-2527]|uniref:Uncharacterized protein n=1 Tax=Kribbella caucasensis TaxID=2512215 RepID=A0A4R6K4P4_9ACTN|nr:hypothetical protein EV643_116102 [Kribbella sp. VKM Ac-2527]
MVFYDTPPTRRLEPIEYDHFWLSELIPLKAETPLGGGLCSKHEQDPRPPERLGGPVVGGSGWLVGCRAAQTSAAGRT